MWSNISHSLRSTVETVLGYERPSKRNQWYDEECREATAAKNAAYRRTLQSAATRAIVDEYRKKRGEERRLIRRKKRELERREREEIELFRCRNDARNFYKKVKRSAEIRTVTCLLIPQVYEESGESTFTNFYVATTARIPLQVKQHHRSQSTTMAWKFRSTMMRFALQFSD